MRQGSQSTVPTKTAVQSAIDVVPASQGPVLAFVPAALAEVALIDAKTAAAAGSVSISSWYALVAAGSAPKPVIQRPRFTRYRLTEVVDFWRDYGSQPDDGEADAAKQRATKASAAARAKRRAAANGTAQVKA